MLLGSNSIIGGNLISFSETLPTLSKHFTLTVCTSSPALKLRSLESHTTNGEMVCAIHPASV
jgi:hypothetical protein